MSEPTAGRHQTVRLRAGRHRSPDDGACAMELASMLAAEPFSDHPKSVCPVIAAFLRSYNDHLDDARRQDLYPYAARSVGTARPGTERGRAAMCLRWAHATFDAPPPRVRLLHRLLRCQGPDIDGVYAARAAAASGRPDAHARALEFLDQLTRSREWTVAAASSQRHEGSATAFRPLGGPVGRP